jgi:hypothetical protein
VNEDTIKLQMTIINSEQIKTKDIKFKILKGYNFELLGQGKYSNSVLTELQTLPIEQ